MIASAGASDISLPSGGPCGQQNGRGSPPASLPLLWLSLTLHKR